MNNYTKKFISDNANADVNMLALQAAKFPEVEIAFALQQIEGRQKMKSKSPTFYANANIIFPVRLSIEQSSSEISARYKANLCSGKSLTDLTGGFGMDCFFMAENFEQTVYVEKNETLCEIVRHNFSMSGRENVEIICNDTEDFLQNCTAVDWFFIDPARRKLSGKKAVLLADCSPDVTKIADLLLEKSQNTMIKLSPMLDIAAVRKKIPFIKEIHIVAVENECKELLIIISKSENYKIKIYTVNIEKKVRQTFDFFVEEEENAISDFAFSAKKYLYEPNAAVMKSAAFKLLGKRYNLQKLHKNTHLYTSDELQKDFCGRIFTVENSWGNSLKTWLEKAKQIKKANIATRNFPLTAENLRKKLKIADGGEVYLFACTLADNTKTILECKKTTNNYRNYKL